MSHNQCRIDGCSKTAKFKGELLCQMHYFRRMRTGKFDLTPKTAIQRRQNPRGYVMVHSPGHPLADKNRYVYEHRKIVFEVYGDNLPPCELCRKAISWKTCHIDHIDRDVTNNNPANLRPLCRGCNTFRDYPPQHTLARRYAITLNGDTKTAYEWSRDCRVMVSSTTIVRRMKNGMSVEDALFSPKKTHKTYAAKTRELIKTRGY
ncbi:MAG: HNH endonuclease [Alphaproteobacteria bacterium]|nr:HNH endonuclease [Alphaproteobacteria bacterium]